MSAEIGQAVLLIAAGFSLAWTMMYRQVVRVEHERDRAIAEMERLYVEAVRLHTIIWGPPKEEV